MTIRQIFPLPWQMKFCLEAYLCLKGVTREEETIPALSDLPMPNQSIVNNIFLTPNQLVGQVRVIVHKMV